MNVYAPSIAPIRPDAPETIPVLDLAPLLRGDPGATQVLGAALRDAFENVGFYFVVNHGVPKSLIDATFDAARRFHDMDLDRKLALRMNKSNVGYLPFKGSITRHSQLNANNQPNLVEAFFAKRELPPGHPDRETGLPFRGPNLWPDDLPGFRETVVSYSAAMERLGLSLLPLYAVSLDLPPDYFAQSFRMPSYTLADVALSAAGGRGGQRIWSRTAHRHQFHDDAGAERRARIVDPATKWSLAGCARATRQHPGERRRPVATLDQ